MPPAAAPAMMREAISTGKLVASVPTVALTSSTAMQVRMTRVFPMRSPSGPRNGCTKAHGNAILTVRTVLEDREDGDVRLVDAPLVEGAIAAAVSASAGLSIDDVARAAEEARVIPKF